MATLMQASRQWATRPNEERFLSLTDLHKNMLATRARSKSVVAPLTSLQAIPVATDQGEGLAMIAGAGNPATISNLGFSQLTEMIGAPKGYLSTLSPTTAAMAVNEGIAKLDGEVNRQFLMERGDNDDSPINIRAINSRTYGRIWNESITSALINRFGDGRTGDWTVPGEFGKQVKITKANTTIYGSDKDMFVFLADEKHRIELPNRRNGEAGSLARGFFVTNSEVGEGVLGVWTFLFDYVCSNRIVWGAENVREIKIKHYSGAPERFLDEVHPALTAMANEKASLTENILKAAQAVTLDEQGISKMFGKLDINPKTQKLIHATHAEEENGRVIESAWDIMAGITAYAKSIPYQSDRVVIERKAGKVLDLIAN